MLIHQENCGFTLELDSGDKVTFSKGDVILDYNDMVEYIYDNEYDSHDIGYAPSMNEFMEKNPDMTQLITYENRKRRN